MPAGLRKRRQCRPGSSSVGQPEWHPHPARRHYSARPLDQSENPRFQRATVSSARAVRLSKLHAGSWIPYSYLSKLRVRRPGLVRRRWTATIVEQNGSVVPLSWRGTRPHALLLWGYVVARRGLGAVDGLP